MILSSQKPKVRILRDDYESWRARHYGLRAVARELGLRDFVASRRIRSSCASGSGRALGIEVEHAGF